MSYFLANLFGDTAELRSLAVPPNANLYSACNSSLATFSSPQKQQDIELDITTWVNENKGSVASLAIDTTSPDGSVIRSRDDITPAQRPRLTIEYKESTLLDKFLQFFRRR